MKTGGGFLITQIKQIQGRIFERLLQRYAVDDVNGSQGRILYVLWQEDRLSIAELSERTGLAKTTLTSMLDRLEKNGVLVREPDGVDRRMTRLLLTEKSRAMEKKYSEVSNEMTRLFYRDFSEEEIRDFEHMLERILVNLTESEDNV